MRGKITRIISGRDFFFIDDDYFCHLSKVDFEPKIGAEVEYERGKNKDGKLEAKNVRQIRAVATQNMNIRSGETDDFFDKYTSELEKGYFEGKYIRNEFLIEFPMALADNFCRNQMLNKSTQIRKYFDFCRKIEGVFKTKKDFGYVKSELPKLIYHVNSAYNKKPPLISKEFKIFIEKNVDLAIKNENNFQKGFISHFEALIGYSKN